jgi:hypothetical protein
VKDAVAVGLTLLAFAALTTAHLAIVVGLSRRPPRWRAAAALFVGPLAIYWAVRERMRARLALGRRRVCISLGPGFVVMSTETPHRERELAELVRAEAARDRAALSPPSAELRFVSPCRGNALRSCP